MCKILEVSRSGYYAHISREKSKTAIENEKLLEIINEEFKISRKLYGSPRLTIALQKKGYKYSKNRVARLMRENGLRAKTVKKYKRTTNSGHRLPVADNLLNQEFEVSSPNKKWTGDITYIWTRQGWLYLAVVLDLFSRRVIGWHIDQFMTKELVINAFRKASENRQINDDILFHSDQGIQYTSNEFVDLLHRKGVKQSMSRRGNCYDNAVTESFFHTLKTELIYFENYSSREDAKLSIFEYIEIYYNRKRLHSSLGYKSPVDFEENVVKLVLD